MPNPYRIAVQLVHVTTVQRDQSAETGWGDAASTDFQDHLVDVPCRYWANAGREATDPKTQVVVEDMRVVVPLDTDVTEHDRLGDITSRGMTIVKGPVGIRAVLANDDHLELVLERIG